MIRVSAARLERLRARPKKSPTVKKIILYYTKLHRAVPPWLDAEQWRQINRIYKDARRRGLVVDHIVPLSSPLVCGLHVPWNLRATTLEKNQEKGNKWWPGCPYSQASIEFKPVQKEMGL